jgi:hypothetical protein
MQPYYNPFRQEPSRSPLGYCFWRYNRRVKPLPPPNVPGKTDYERFDNAVRQVLTVSKTELLRREEREKQKPEVKRPKKS